MLEEEKKCNVIIRLAPKTHHKLKMLCVSKKISMQQMMEGMILRIIEKEKVSIS